MSEKSTEDIDYFDLMEKLPLFSCIIKEAVWLKKVVTSKAYLKKIIEDPQLLKDFSILKSIRADEASASVKENAQLKKKAQAILDRQLKLYEDLQWAKLPAYFWPVHLGDYSPLSPDGEFVDRHGKLGLDFWQWNRETSPLGYVPPLCTCKRTEDCITTVKKWSNDMRLEFEHRVCDNDVCKGMLYIPYSLLEIPLNRAISNASEFAQKVRVPNETDVYCGNMKHTIILCTTGKRHEERCLQAIELSEVPSPLIYDVESEDFIPYFRKYDDLKRESPLMTVEPIDSDVTESEHNYGLGQIFAIRRWDDRIMFEKYDLETKKTSPIDDLLDETWEKLCNLPKSDDAQELSNDEPTEELDDKELEKADDETKGTNSEDDDSSEEQVDLGLDINDEEVNLDIPVSPNDLDERFSEYSEETPSGDVEEDLEEVAAELRRQPFRLYRLIESFSSDRRPLRLALRGGLCPAGLPKRTLHRITFRHSGGAEKRAKVATS